jgi:Cu(I)/Ag(I) efflux system membrane fusion protein
MNKPGMIAGAALLALMTGAGGYWLGGRGVPPTAPAAPAGKRVLYWHDPMMPGQKFDKPGKSPFMDMQLVPVYADETSANATPGVTVDGSTRQALGMRTASVVSGPIGSSIRAVGSVAVDERGIAVVQARTAGFVERLYVRAQYDPVRAGQTLVTITAPDWAAVQEDFLALKRTGSAGLLDAARARMRLAGMSAGDIAAVERTGRVAGALPMTSPVSGYVAELLVREGMTVAPGQTLARIAGLGTVWIDAQVPEAVSGGVAVGDRVTIETPALIGAPVAGRVTALLPLVSPETRTRGVRITAANPSHRLVPGMTATIAFTPGRQTEALLVPTEAVIRTGTRSIVFVDRGKGRYEAAEVTVGRSAGASTEVLAGLKLGETIVTSGQFLLDSEASLRGVPVRSAPVASTSTPVAAAQSYTGTAVVEAVKPGTVTLSHGPIAGLGWPAMTMVFATRLPAAAIPAPGARVQFEMTMDPKTGAAVTAITPVQP